MPAGLHWIPLDVDFPGSRKAIALGVALQEPLAWAYVVRLWTWAARNAPDGHVEGPDAVAVIEQAAGWRGQPGAFVAACALGHVRLLDEVERGFSIHDWTDHCGAHLEKKAKDADRMRRKREQMREQYGNRSRTVREPSSDVRRNSNNNKNRNRDTSQTGSEETSTVIPFDVGGQP